MIKPRLKNIHCPSFGECEEEMRTRSKIQTQENKSNRSSSNDSTESLDDPGLFNGLLAWFSTSVSKSRKQAWVDNGGQIGDLENALFVFSEDFNAQDTVTLYQSEQYIKNHLSVFHASYIDECVQIGKPKSVCIGDYFLPPAAVFETVKKHKITVYKWEDESSRPSIQSPQRASHQPGASIAASSSNNNATDTLEEEDFPDYVHVKNLRKANVADVTEFIIDPAGKSKVRWKTSV